MSLGFHKGSALSLNVKKIWGKMVEGYVGEIFNSLQGEGPYVGSRQVFVRFAGCSLRCMHCNTLAYRSFSPRFCNVEVRAGVGKFMRVPNPIGPEALMDHVERLLTPDVHLVSLTGGEPLESGEFLIEVARACKGSRLATYLETNGADSETMGRVAPYLDFASIDVKLPEHEAVPRNRWSKLFEEELACIGVARARGLRAFAKVVILGSSSTGPFKRVCERLAGFKIPLIIQPVTPRGKISAPPIEKLFAFSEIAAKAGVREISIIPQVHKLIGVK